VGRRRGPPRHLGHNGQHALVHLQLGHPDRDRQPASPTLLDHLHGGRPYHVVPDELACRRFARKAIEEARSDRFKLTTVPSGKIPGLESFYVWTPSMGFYVVFVWVCALLINSRRLHDVYFYMSAVAAVNIGLFYLVKCGRHGAEVRGGLTRAFLAAERVRRVAEAPQEVVDHTRPPTTPEANSPVAVGAAAEGTMSRGPSIP
jgi:hypothetical protein